MAKGNKKGKESAVITPHPECCGKPMAVNQRLNRASGPRIVYRCTGKCGKTRTYTL